jgi:hypothetical protein
LHTNRPHFKMQGSGAAASRRDDSTRLRNGDNVVLGGRLAEEYHTDGNIGIFCLQPDGSARVVIHQLKLQIYLGPALSQNTSSEVIKLDCSQYRPGSVYVRLKNLHRSQREYEGRYAVVTNNINQFRCDVLPIGPNGKILTLYHCQMRSVSFPPNVTLPACEVKDLFILALGNVIKANAKFSRAQPGVIDRNSDAGAKLYKDLAESLQALSCFRHSFTGSSVFSTGVSLLECSTDMPRGGESYAKIGDWVYLLHDPTDPLHDGVGCFGVVKWFTARGNDPISRVAVVLGKPYEGIEISYNPDRIIPASDVDPYIQSPFPGSVVRVSGLSNHTRFNGWMGIAARELPKGAFRVVFCPGYARSDMAILNVPRQCLTRCDEYMHTDIYPKSLYIALQLYEQFSDIVHRYRRANDLLCILRHYISAIGDGEITDLESFEAFTRRLNVGESAIRPLRRVFDSLMGNDRIIPMRAALKQMEADVTDSLTALDKLKTEYYLEHPIFNVGDVIVIRSIGEHARITGYWLGYYTLEMLGSRRYDILRPSSDMELLEPPTPAQRYRSMQEMQGMPPDVSVTVPVTDENMPPDVSATVPVTDEVSDSALNLDAAASADQEPCGAAGAARLSQGQLKKLKQRRSKERKKEATKFVNGIVDGILKDAFVIGEISLVERQIENCEGQLKRDVVTAVNRLKIHADCLKGQILRELQSTIPIMIGSAAEDISNHLPDLFLDDIIDTVLTRASNEEVLRQEAVDGSGSSLGRVLFLAENPELQRSRQMSDCAVCFAEICLLDPDVRTVMCCDGRWKLCPSCLERVKSSPPHVSVDGRPPGHRFQDCAFFHLNEWAGLVLRALYRP